MTLREIFNYILDYQWHFSHWQFWMGVLIPIVFILAVFFLVEKYTDDNGWYI